MYEPEILPGILQSEIVGDLVKVPKDMTKTPHLTFDGFKLLTPEAQEWFRCNFLCEDFAKYCTGLSLAALETLGFDKLCKTAFSGGYMRDDVRRAFDADPHGTFRPHLLIEKIRLSMWRWGYADRDWNQVVDAWDGLKAFDLGVDGFSVELDYTPWHHRRGWGVRSQTYLDGSFAFLVRWKDQHVMTLAFSFGRDRSLLVQQVQSKSKRGNRWMYRFPKRRFEHVLSCFAEAFPNHVLHLVGGKSIGNRNIDGYQSSIDDYRQSRARHLEWAETTESEERRAGYLADAEAVLPKIAALEEKIVALKADLPRLERMYADTGRFRRLGRAVKVEGLAMYPMGVVDVEELRLAA